MSWDLKGELKLSGPCLKGNCVCKLCRIVSVKVLRKHLGSGREVSKVGKQVA